MVPGGFVYRKQVHVFGAVAEMSMIMASNGSKEVTEIWRELLFFISHIFS